METALLVSTGLLWVLVLAMAVVIFALVRQIGVLYERVAPAGALMVGGGPKVGEQAPVIEVSSLTGAAFGLGAPRADGRGTLVFFLSPTCPVCHGLLPALRSLLKRERDWLDGVLASDGEPERQRRFISEHRLEDLPYVLSTELGLSYQVGKLPYAVLIDGAGIVRARGLINSREHLESLLEAKERGVATIQEYLRRRKTEKDLEVTP